MTNMILPVSTTGTNNWVNFNTTSSVSSGIATVTPNAQHGGFYYKLPLDISNSIMGDVIYSRASIKSTSAISWVFGNDGVTQGLVNNTGNNTYETVSGIKTIALNKVLSGQIYFKTQDSKASGWATHYLQKPMAIDLTSSFGVGNEPDKTFMDRMPYFSSFGGYKNSYNISGSNQTFNITPMRTTSTTSVFSTVTCTNGQTGTVSNNVLTVSNITNNTVCTITYSSIDSIGL